MKYVLVGHEKKVTEKGNRREKRVHIREIIINVKGTAKMCSFRELFTSRGFTLVQGWK